MEGREALHRYGVAVGLLLGFCYLLHAVLFPPAVRPQQNEREKKYIAGELIVTYRYERAPRSRELEGRAALRRQWQAARAILNHYRLPPRRGRRQPSRPVHKGYLKEMRRNHRTELSMHYAAALRVVNRRLLRGARIRAMASQLSARRSYGFSKSIVLYLDDQAELDLELISRVMMSIPRIRRSNIVIESVSPNYLLETGLTPNDELVVDGTQWGHTRIGAEDAWDTNIGHPEVVIGVIDTGVDYEHPDLINKIYSGDDPEGDADGDGDPDDDDNGYTDDFRGWDFLERSNAWCIEDCSAPDNNPMDPTRTRLACCGNCSC